jgi:hypothetical protein
MLCVRNISEIVRGRRGVMGRKFGKEIAWEKRRAR